MPVAHARQGQRGRPEKKKACGQDFEAALEEELARLIAPGAADELDFEALETYVRRKALQLAARAVETRLNRDRSDAADRTRRCSCGQPARYAGRRRKTFTSALGELTLERAYFHCPQCAKGSFPRDEQLGMAHTALSPAVQRMSASAAARVSFAEASQLLEDLAGIAVHPKHVERTARAIGQEIARAEVGQVPADSHEVVPDAATMYVEIDGTGVPARKSETAGRKGKQADGSGRTREAKLLTVFTAESRDAEGRPQRDRGSASYSAAIESAASNPFAPQPSAFSRRVWREASRRGVFAARRQVVIADGAAWIWSVVREQMPAALEILDLFHAKERLWDVAKALHADHRDLLETWAETRCEELEQGRWKQLMQSLGREAASCEQARQCQEYFRTHRQRMRYPEFRAQGLCVGSGAIEAACKTAVGTRLKRSGMRWTVAGANAILALRCNILSGRFEDFWAERTTGTAYEPCSGDTDGVGTAVRLANSTSDQGPASTHPSRSNR